MAIQIADGFQLRVAKPLDDRQNVETVAQLDPTYGYEGQIVYVKDIKQFYTCYKDEDGSLAYKVMETGNGGGSSEKQIKDWVSGGSYLEGDYIYREGEIYRCLNSNNTIDFGEANWEQLTYGIDELSKEDVERLLGLTKEEIEAMADLILDTEVRIDKTYSSSKIYTDIQQCLEDSKAYTLLELGKFSGVSYKIVASTSEMTSESIIYLLENGNTYDMYIVEENGATTKIGDTNVNLSDYYTKTEVDNDFLKKVDADGKYATITTVDGKVDKDKIVTTLNDSVTDKQVASALLIKTELDKTNAKLGEKVDKSYVDDNFATMNKVKDGYVKIIKNNDTDADEAMVISYKNRDLFGVRIYKKDNSEHELRFATSGISYVKNGVTVWTTTRGNTGNTGVADIPKTTITPAFPNGVIVGSGGVVINYVVKNGWCNVDFEFNVESATVLTWNNIATGLPKPANNVNIVLVNDGGKINRTIPIKINSNGSVSLRVPTEIPATVWWCGNISYPVAE